MAKMSLKCDKMFLERNTQRYEMLIDLNAALCFIACYE